MPRPFDQPHLPQQNRGKGPRTKKQRNARRARAEQAALEEQERRLHRERS